jgi:hypothetical protein
VRHLHELHLGQARLCRHSFRGRQVLPPLRPAPFRAAHRRHRGALARQGRRPCRGGHRHRCAPQPDPHFRQLQSARRHRRLSALAGDRLCHADRRRAIVARLADHGPTGPGIGSANSEPLAASNAHPHQPQARASRHETVRWPQRPVPPHRWHRAQLRRQRKRARKSNISGAARSAHRRPRSRPPPPLAHRRRNRRGRKPAANCPGSSGRGCRYRDRHWLPRSAGCA